ADIVEKLDGLSAQTPSVVSRTLNYAVI
ncbi:hypothetical protein J2Z84_005077, partial [Agrobacterium rubi]|nr:hypothetical protein [Agrobacterium rubi]